MKELERAVKLRKEGKLGESNEILINLTDEYPDNSIINYQCVCSFDVMGLEKQAVPYYEKSILIGLPDKDLQGAFLGLGSTYRTLGQYKKSKFLYITVPVGFYNKTIVVNRITVYIFSNFNYLGVAILSYFKVFLYINLKLIL